MKKTLFSLLFLFSGMLHAQFYVGWNGAHGNPRELNREIYVYNTVNRSGLTKEMANVHWSQGLVLGYKTTGDVFFDLQYIRKAAVVSSEFTSNGVDMKRQIKTQLNTLNFGAGVQSGSFVFGGSFDFGKYKGKGKRDDKTLIKKDDWTKLWVVDGSFLVKCTPGLTAFIGYQPGRLGVRLFYQFQLFRLQYDRLDPWLFGAPLNGTPDFPFAQEDRFNNLGIEATFSFGKK